jgi:hypothetical protein
MHLQGPQHTCSVVPVCLLGTASCWEDVRQGVPALTTPIALIVT